MKAVVLFILFFSALTVNAQQHSYAMAVGTTILRQAIDPSTDEESHTTKRRYDTGLLLEGIEGLWMATGDAVWFHFIQNNVDALLLEDGSFQNSKPGFDSIDLLDKGRIILMLYEVTGKEKYKKAADLLYRKWFDHFETGEGGVLNKDNKRDTVLPDGWSLAIPFITAYARLFHEDNVFQASAFNLAQIERKIRNPKTGLYLDNESTLYLKQPDTVTGRSRQNAGGTMVRYGRALVEALDAIPAATKGKDTLLLILNRLAKAMVRFKDPATGLWLNFEDKPYNSGKYLDFTNSSLCIYILAKALRKGYLPLQYTEVVQKGYAALLKQSVRLKNSQLNIKGAIVADSKGMPVIKNGTKANAKEELPAYLDPNELSAFLMAALEVERSARRNMRKEPVVLLDTYFNNEWKKDVTGTRIRYHYTWEDRTNSGFSMLGDLFDRYGFRLASLSAGPEKMSLESASVYIIVDPDTEKETEKPNVMTDKEAATITNWVRHGGILVLMGNDAGNANLASLNTLSEHFGIHFNNDNFNQVEGTQWEQGAVLVQEHNPLFQVAKKLYVKELSTLRLVPPASAIVTKAGKTIAGIACLGKGAVFAIGDPWIYNEYLDGRRLSPDFDNYKGAEDLVRWIAKQIKVKRMEPRL